MGGNVIKLLTVLLLVVAGVLFVLAGSNVNGPRFVPQWWAFACLIAIALLAEAATAPWS
jgi:uncharacterized membrane protein YhdT